MKDQDLVLFLPAFGEVELTNALELRLFRKELSRAEISAAQRAFEEDLRGGILVLKAVPAAVYGQAKQLARRHTSSLGVRTLDILHVAAAFVWSAEAFCSFDVVQRKLVQAIGFARLVPARS
jgi:hypothetical protein